MRFGKWALAVCAALLSVTAFGGARLTTHYTRIDGTVGKELVNPETGTAYLDKDLCDIADGNWGDESITMTGTPPGLYFNKFKKVYGVGKPWYDVWDQYHPLSGLPTTAGTYNWTITATWRDGVKESVTILVVIASSAQTPSSRRLSTHYARISGQVGKELVNPETGTAYLDKDLCDIAEGDWGDESVTVTGLPPGLSFDKSRKIAGVGKAWYDSWDMYHPLSGTPTKAGTYQTKITARWPDGISETVSITFEIAGDSSSSTVSLDAFMKAQVLHEALWNDDEVAGILELKVGKANMRKGTVKISAKAYLLDGTTLSAGGGVAEFLSTGTSCRLSTVTLDFKKRLPVLSLDLWSDNSSGRVEYAFSASSQDGYWAESIDGEALDYLPSNARFRRPGFDCKGPAADFAVLHDKLPDGVSVMRNGNKLVCASNEAKLKLNYAPKMQVFKGSFTVFSEQVEWVKKPKVKKTNFKVTGVIYRGAGYGVATERKAGSWPVSIQQ